VHGTYHCKENKDMTFGTVKHFDLTKGCGLIAPDGGRRDVFVYQPDVDRAGLGQLAARQRLGFDTGDCRSGPKAANLWATFGDR
jgi:CspA family cold shock protein